MVIRHCSVETANSRFDVTISDNDGKTGYVLEYYGSAPKFAQVLRPGAPTPIMKDVGEGTIKGPDPDELFEQVRLEIEKLDGRIESVTDLAKWPAGAADGPTLPRAG